MARKCALDSELCFNFNLSTYTPYGLSMWLISALTFKLSNFKLYILFIKGIELDADAYQRTQRSCLGGGSSYQLTD